MEPRSLYVHLPFCLHKCSYCDFTVRVLHQSTQIDRYLDHLELELQHIPQRYPLDTLYCGGGTPSLLNTAQFQRLHTLLNQAFDLSQLQEWTFEANPETVTPLLATGWKSAGVHRISLGVQSFDDQELMACGRTHRSEHVKSAVEILTQAGIAQISFDLIYGLPGQTLPTWEHTLEQALLLRPTHLSLYCLAVHNQTAWGYLEQQQRLDLPEDETLAQCYQLAVDHLQAAGYQHYEIANWCRPGYQSAHNLAYWHNVPYLAVGVGAHGYYQNRRYANPNSLTAYYAQCQQGQTAWAEAPPMTLQAEIEETVFLGLRLLDEGLDRAKFAQRFGQTLESVYPQTLPQLIHNGQLIDQGQRLLLHPDAVLTSNEVFSALLEPEGLTPEAAPN
jgi:putative oxygen-independent coproporphyrinogen III oxidase